MNIALSYLLSNWAQLRRHSCAARRRSLKGWRWVWWRDWSRHIHTASLDDSRPRAIPSDASRTSGFSHHLLKSRTPAIGDKAELENQLPAFINFLKHKENGRNTCIIPPVWFQKDWHQILWQELGIASPILKFLDRNFQRCRFHHSWLCTPAALHDHSQPQRYCGPPPDSLPLFLPLFLPPNWVGRQWRHGEKRRRGSKPWEISFFRRRSELIPKEVGDLGVRVVEETCQSLDRISPNGWPRSPGTLRPY